MIRFEQVTKTFGGIRALDAVSLQAHSGEMLALIGPNGSGKSTALRLAFGLARPTTGQVIITSADHSEIGADAHAGLGYLPQRLRFPEQTTASVFVHLFARMSGASHLQVGALLERVGLANVCDDPIETFTDSQKQRLGIAIALLGDPHTLLLDEPTGILDSSDALAVRALLADLRVEGRSLILASHDLAEVEELADRIAILNAGQLLAAGTLGELAQQYNVSASLTAIYQAAIALPPIRLVA